MAEDLIISDGLSRAERYQEIIPQIKALVEDEPDMIANMANIAAALKEGLGFFWIGFYLVKEEELVLGPFQGPVACTRIKKGKGVCGFAWENKKTILVSDVDQFPGHISCNSQSKSEIVLPIIKNNEVDAILDVDSDQVDDFSEIDEKFLNEVIKIIEGKIT